jgi:tetratricopeptide (TPR) repeat protein
MAKRVAVARAIAEDPAVIFYDEPTTGLDPVVSGHVHELVWNTHHRRRADGLVRTSVIVTHDQDLLRRIGPRVVMLDEGAVCYDGSYERFGSGDSCAAARQYLRAMPVLHAAHKTHRDLKPSNILVTPQGRVVILDFGIISELHRVERWNQYKSMGTVAYMAPEQADAQPVGAAADWYSVGVVLYEALTGVLPHRGQPSQILEHKRCAPPPPSALVPGVPEDLDALCAALLQADPAARPSGAELLQRLRIAPPNEVTAGSQSPEDFVGRGSELALLERAFADSRSGQAVTVQVHGESGVGKSFLVRHFLATVTRAAPQTVLFCGRCYERELLAYKAVDGVIDELSGYLLQLPEAEARALLPRNLPLLAKLFPVLEASVALAQAAPLAQAPEDPVVLRTRAFLALRELLHNLAKKVPLIIVVDDLQWADADSFVLLNELLRPPDAPPLLLLTTVRDRSAIVEKAGSSPDLARLPGDVRSLALGKLAAREARQLAQRLLAGFADSGTAMIELIAQEAQGHPLFIDELVRQRRFAGSQQAPLRLDDALWARVQRLEAPARQLLEVVAVAGAPIAQERIARAAATSPGEFDALTAQLRAAHLVRTTGARQTDAIEPYHDRVRESILSHLDRSCRTDWHSRLAVALESSGTHDPEALVLHWQEAGNAERAAGYAIQAADQAASALAFARAASHYRRALELHPLSGPARSQLLAKLGTALTNASRGAEAAPVFLAAAADAATGEACDLQRRAAEQFLVSGHIDKGLQVLEQVLAAVGLKMASTPAQALLSLFYGRARLKLRGLQFTARAVEQVPPDVLLRVDVCWAVWRGLGLVDTVRTADFQTRHLLLALEAGEPYRVARGLVMEAAFRSTEGGPSRSQVEQLMGRAKELAEQVGNRHAMGLVALFTGMAAYLRGDWAPGLASLEQAQSMLLESCTGVAWEEASAHRFALGALMYLGRLKELQQRVHRLLATARETGNLYTATDIRTRYSIAWLAADDPAGAKRQIEEALVEWSTHGFHLQHYSSMLGLVQLALYKDCPEDAWALLAQKWPELRRSLLLRVQLLRLEVLHLRARSALAVVASGGRAELLKQVVADVEAIAKEHMEWSAPLVSLVRAGLAACRGDRAQAALRLRAAVHECDRSHMGLYGAAARWRLANLLPADSREGQALRAQAQGFMAEQEIRNPRRMVAMLAPGFASPTG